MKPPPDPLTVSVNLFHAMKRHTMNAPFPVHQPEHFRLIPRKFDLVKRHRHDPLFDTVKIAHFELPARELRIPADAVKQFMNRRQLSSYLLNRKFTRS